MIKEATRERSQRYSAKGMVKPVNFYFVAPDAKAVSVIGEFNDWRPNANPMLKRVDGTWFAEVMLTHGHHHYLFLADGKPMLDPRGQGIARNEHRHKVSMIAVS
jgi:1,4-alpha-glucan branching enzyme